MTTEIPAVHNWSSNGHLIADVAKLGYLKADMMILDPTYGRGGFWTQWSPPFLVASDLRTYDLPEDSALPLRGWVDFRSMPYEDREFDAVVFDPPYKLNGTPALGDFDNRYGVDVPMRWQDKHDLIKDGIAECLRVLRPGGTFLLKCQDQVCSGQMRWQTYEFTHAAVTLGARLVDRFDLLGKGRPQPAGRTQKHARYRPSTLLIFRKSA